MKQENNVWLYDVPDDGVEVSSYSREIKSCGILHIHLI